MTYWQGGYWDSSGISILIFAMVLLQVWPWAKNVGKGHGAVRHKDQSVREWTPRHPLQGHSEIGCFLMPLKKRVHVC